MAWEDQGRQEHGWFGHGTSGALIDRNDGATQKRLSSGAAIAAMSAYEYLLHQDGKTVADAFDLGQTIPALKALVPVWAGGAHLPPTPFRETLFGKDFAPRPAEELQTTVQRLIFARTVADEQAAGEDLAAAVRGIRVAKWQDFLEVAQNRVETLQLREKILQLQAQLETSKAAAAVKAAAPTPDGSGDRIKPVYPVESLLPVGRALLLSKSALGVAMAIGGTIARQELPDGLLSTGDEPPAEPTPEAKPLQPDTLVAEEGAGDAASKEIDNAIEAALKSADKGAKFEGETAKTLKSAGIRIISFKKAIWRTPKEDGLAGEIDIETPHAIIETTTGPSRKLTQITKLIHDKSINPQGKPVILYAKGKFNWRSAQDLGKAGAFVVRTPDELIRILRELESH